MSAALNRELPPLQAAVGIVQKGLWSTIPKAYTSQTGRLIIKVLAARPNTEARLF